MIKENPQHKKKIWILDIEFKTWIFDIKYKIWILNIKFQKVSIYPRTLYHTGVVSPGIIAYNLVSALSVTHNGTGTQGASALKNSALYWANFCQRTNTSFNRCYPKESPEAGP